MENIRGLTGPIEILNRTLLMNPVEAIVISHLPNGEFRIEFAVPGGVERMLLMLKILEIQINRMMTARPQGAPPL
jgi:hypothetical protein